MLPQEITADWLEDGDDPRAEKLRIALDPPDLGPFFRPVRLQKRLLLDFERPSILSAPENTAQVRGLTDSLVERGPPAASRGGR